jgi:DnaJ-class molecular chaperone
MAGENAQMEEREMAPGDEVPAGRENAAPDICPRCGGSGKLQGRDCETRAGTGEVQEAVGGG